MIAVLALYRPGPLGSGMVDMFVDRKHGKEKTVYPHEATKPVLEPTYGVIVYQKQVMQISNIIGGFSMAEADNLRKAMGKKKPQIMEQFAAKFVEGAVKNGCAENVARETWDNIVKFGGYGFNKPHSTAYALLAYQTAYLKANYPRHFMAALLTIESQNTAKLAAYLHECRELRVPILPPDVNSSDLAFAVRPEGVRFGLGAVKNVGESAMA